MKANINGLSKSVQLGRGGFLTSSDSSRVTVSTDGTAENKGIISAKTAELDTLELPSMAFGSNANTSFYPFEGNDSVRVLDTYLDMVNYSIGEDESPVSSITLSVDGLDVTEARELLIWTVGQGKVYFPIQASSWSEFCTIAMSKIPTTVLDGYISISLNGTDIIVRSTDSSNILRQALISKGCFGTFAGNEYTNQIENSLGNGLVNNSYVSNVILSIEADPVSYEQTSNDSITFSVLGFYVGFADGRKPLLGVTSREEAEGMEVDSGVGLKTLYKYCDELEANVDVTTIDKNVLHDIWLVYDNENDTFSISLLPTCMYHHDYVSGRTGGGVWYDRSTNLLKRYESDDWVETYAVRIGRVKFNSDGQVSVFRPFYPFQIADSTDVDNRYISNDNYLEFLGSSSGNLQLETNNVYEIQTGGNVILNPITPSNTSIHNQIKVFLNRTDSAHTVTTSAVHYIGGDAPDFSGVGTYIVYFDWFPYVGWCVGAMPVS